MSYLGRHMARDAAPLISMRAARIMRGRRSILDGVSFDIHLGEIVGLVGPNGAGKTTLMKAMAGLLPLDAGEIRLAGRCGLQLDNPPFIEDIDGRGNLRMLAHLDGTTYGQVDEAMRAVGLDPALRTRVGGYSQGMRKRLGIAQAIMGDVSAIFLDEPMNGLDPEGMVTLRRVVAGQRDLGRAIIISSHLLGELEGMCDSVYLVARGKVRRLTWDSEPGGLEKAYLGVCDGRDGCA